jgi:hypothetical protein
MIVNNLFYLVFFKRDLCIILTVGQIQVLATIDAKLLRLQVGGFGQIILIGVGVLGVVAGRIFINKCVAKVFKG